MTRAGRVCAAGAAALVLALSGGCSSLALPAARPSPAPVQAAWPGCEAVGAFTDDRGQGPAGVGGVPKDFTARTVVLCGTDLHEDASGTSGASEVERTSTDVAPLLAYLARRGEAPSLGSCTADAWIAPWLFLVNAEGQYVAPRIPVDGCGKPLGWYDRDTEPLAWEKPVYAERVLREVPPGENSQARQAGCPTATDDVLDAWATSSRHRSGGFSTDPFGGRALRYCTYDVATTSGGGHGSPVFASGYSLLEDERVTAVGALIAAPPAPAACAMGHTGFTLLGPRDDSANLLIETDGCRRVVSDGDETPVVRASDELVALLGG